MSVDKAFVDTNILIYIYSIDDQKKHNLAIKQINKYDRILSTQVLNEFCNVCIRKLKLEPLKVEAAVDKICRTNTLSIVNKDTVKYALFIHRKYSYSYYDSLIIASALENECDYLLSEDLANGQVIEGSLTICNIFSNNLIKG
ncbi:MAG: PIN domain-containing protein [Streptococcaceae bacterium]|jgi:predicted nucleic acid-binding protein|nr:PIN domain-containing protein [Streptococcaceae bacterium]